MTTTDIELSITGMTCASCANRIERKLNKLEGVTAAVNFATEKAKVTFPAGLPPDDLVSTVEQAGYGATLPVAARPAEAEAGDDPTRSLRERLVISAVLSLPVVALAMVPDWQFDYWQWLSLPSPRPLWSGAPGRSTRPPGRTCVTAPRRWTP